MRYLSIRLDAGQQWFTRCAESGGLSSRCRLIHRTSSSSPHDNWERRNDGESVEAEGGRAEDVLKEWRVYDCGDDQAGGGATGAGEGGRDGQKDHQRLVNCASSSRTAAGRPRDLARSARTQSADGLHRDRTGRLTSCADPGTVPPAHGADRCCQPLVRRASLAGRRPAGCPVRRPKAESPSA